MRKRIFLKGALVCLLVTNFVTAQSPATTVEPSSASKNAATLTHAELSAKIAQAKNLLKAQSSAAVSDSSVTLAALDSATSQIHLFSVSKDSFLTAGASMEATSQLGHMVRVRVLNPNGVNTAVSVKDVAHGRTLLPLVVEYPIVKGGTVKEMAYYTSAHPVLQSPEVIAAGETYVTTMLDQAAANLARNGVSVSPELVNIARHLVIVEHTDHKRFKNADPGVYPEVLSLYALNRGNTYRYSVSSAGAGGMIQMIPRTYDAIRAHHPNVSLKADFVGGMQDHENALKAMLLYINDTWKFLAQSEEVQEALRSGAATKTELLAAGYNSNPYRLPGYLSTGGSAWRTLIPAETQMYLAIYKSVDRHLDFAVQEIANPVEARSSTSASFTAGMVREAHIAVISWVGNQVLRKGLALSNLLP